MILPDMTSEQMKKVFADDQPALSRFANHFMATDGTRILRSKATTFPCSITRFWESPVSRQRYILNWRIAARIEAYAKGSRYYVRAVINTMYGTEMANQMMNPDTGEISIVYYNAHLLLRYAERMGLPLRGDELVRYFVKRNPMLIEASRWRKEQDCMMLCHDGACFGEVSKDDPKFIRLKTFIATETMQDETYRAKLNGQYDEALCNALCEHCMRDPEMANFLLKTTKRRKA